jgi:hypothetical protein
MTLLIPFSATAITFKHCFGTDVYQKDVKQDKWAVSVHLANSPGTFLLRFFELDITLILLSTQVTMPVDSPAKV